MFVCRDSTNADLQCSATLAWAWLRAITLRRGLVPQTTERQQMAKEVGDTAAEEELSLEGDDEILYKIDIPANRCHSALKP